MNLTSGTINCKDLKIQHCEYEAQAASSGDALTEMVEHLKDEHSMNLPDPADILEGKIEVDELDEKTILLITRMREALDLPSVDFTPDPDEAVKAATAQPAPAMPPQDIVH